MSRRVIRGVGRAAAPPVALAGGAAARDERPDPFGAPFGPKRWSHFSKEDRAAFADARIAALHAGLRLTPDQEKLWPPVVAAIRDLSGVRGEQREAGVQGGLLVQGVSGPAANSGIQAGDIVLSFNGTPVNTIEQLRSLVAKAGKHAAVLVQRENAKIFVPIELG